MPTEDSHGEGQLVVVTEVPRRTDEPLLITIGRKLGQRRYRSYVGFAVGVLVLTTLTLAATRRPATRARSLEGR